MSEMAGGEPEVLDEPSPTSLWRRVILLAVAAVILYGLAPALIEIYSEVRNLADIRFGWFALMVVLMSGSLACTWVLLRVALPEASWFVAATSQLAANAFSRVVPGSAAAGGALQYRMLYRGGVDATAAGAALTAVSLITTGVVFALPIATVPVILGGVAIPGELLRAAILGVFVFVALAAVAAVLLLSDRAIGVVAQTIHFIQKTFRANPGPVPVLQAKLERERREVVAELGTDWQRALVAALGNRLLEYLVLLVALVAVGAESNWALYLLAYVAATVLAMIPLTPGGLGFVEAGLTTMLTIAGVPFDQAALAVLAFRLVNFWLPLPAGLIAYAMFNRRVASQ